MMQIIPFTEIANGLKGYWEDTLEFDKLLIEMRECQKCRRKLVYKGFSNSTQHKAFGVCVPCKFARHFWTETTVFARAKKRISERGASAG